MRLRDCPSDRFNWHDLHVFIRHSRPNSNLFAELFPERANWDLQTQLLGLAVDYLALLLWTKSKGARRGYGRPRSVLPGAQKRREGSKPAAAPLSVVRARMQARHARRGPRHLEVRKPRAQAIRDALKPDPPLRR